MPEKPRKRHGRDFNYGSDVNKSYSDYQRGRQAGRRNAKMPTRKQVGSTEGGGGGKPPKKTGLCMLMLMAQIWMASDSERKATRRGMMFPRFRSNAARGRSEAKELRKPAGQVHKEAVDRLGHRGLLRRERYTDGK